MTSYVTPKKNAAFILYVGLEDQANAGLFKAAPTLATGDFKVSIDGGTLNNLTDLPTVTPTGGRMVKITLTAAEMNGDNVTVVCSDAAGAEWYDLIVNIQTSARQIDDLSTLGGTAQTGDAYAVVSHTDYGNAKLVRATTPANTLDIEATGEASANVTYSAGVPLGGRLAEVTDLSAGSGLTAQQTADAVHNLAPAGTPAAGSIGDHLDDLATALAAATSTLTVVSAVDGDVLTIYQAVSFQATVSGLSIPAAWTKLWFTAKQDPGQVDTDAIIQMIETNPAAGTDGLLRLNGAAGTAGNGTLTVSQAAGTVVIDLVDENTDDLALATGLHWSLKALASGGATTLLAIGTLNVRGQATMAVA